MNKSTLIIIGIILVAFGGLFWFARGGTSTGSTSITAGDWARGAANPKVTVIEYGDFQCPACGAYEPLLKQAQTEFKDTLRFAYRQFPLTQIHPNALLASKVSEAAGAQGKFWEMHDILFEKQSEWSGSASARTLFTAYATSLGLDLERLETDIDSDTITKKIQDDYQGGRRLGVNSTPTLFVNGQKIISPRDYAEFKKILEDAIAKGTVVSGTGEAFHAHADFKVYVNGAPVDFSLAKYQSNKGKDLDKYSHLHDGNGNVLHLHQEGITFRYFLTTLGVVLTADCLGLDTGERYCKGEGKTLRLFVNGAEVANAVSYEPKDTDRILLTYGKSAGTALEREIASVTDMACIYSEKCPERGTPPTEECVGGLGTECTE